MTIPHRDGEFTFGPDNEEVQLEDYGESILIVVGGAIAGGLIAIGSLAYCINWLIG